MAEYTYNIFGDRRHITGYTENILEKRKFQDK